MGTLTPRTHRYADPSRRRGQTNVESTKKCSDEVATVSSTVGLSARPFVDDYADAILAAAMKQDKFVDDTTGQPLLPELCREARKLEVDYFKSKGVWELRPVSEAHR